MVKYEKSVSTETAMQFIREHGFTPELKGSAADGVISFDVMPKGEQPMFEEVDTLQGRVNFRDLKDCLGY